MEPPLLQTLLLDASLQEEAAKGEPAFEEFDTEPGSHKIKTPLSIQHIKEQATKEQKANSEKCNFYHQVEVLHLTEPGRELVGANYYCLIY